MERFERLLDRRLGIEPVDLVEVDVVGAEAAERRVDGLEDVLARQASSVDVIADRVEDLGRHHHFVAARQLTQRASQDLLAAAA